MRVYADWLAETRDDPRVDFLRARAAVLELPDGDVRGPRLARELARLARGACLRWQVRMGDCGPAPGAFAVCRGGFRAATWMWTVREGRLVRHTQLGHWMGAPTGFPCEDGGRQEGYAISETNWLAFADRLEEDGIWAMRTMRGAGRDGSWWRLEAEHGGRRVQAWGHNAGLGRIRRLHEMLERLARTGRRLDT